MRNRFVVAGFGVAALGLVLYLGTEQRAASEGLQPTDASVSDALGEAPDPPLSSTLPVPHAAEHTAPEGRAAYVADRLQVAVRAAGSPASNALVRWTCLSDELRRSEASGPGWIDLVRSHSVEARTDDAGVATFADALTGTDQSASVLWALLDGFDAARVLLGPGMGAPATPIELRPAASIRVEVEPYTAVDPRDVRVLQTSSIPDANVADRVLFAEHALDEDGSCRAVQLAGRQRIEARTSELASAPWFGVAATEVKLRLAATFACSGRVVLQDDARADGSSIRVRRRTAGSWGDDCWIPVRADGRFGPTSVAIADAERFSFKLLGGDLVRAVQYRDPPRPNEHIRLQFDGLPGASLRVRIVDIRRTPVPGASVTARWAVDDSSVTSNARTDAEGRALLRGLAAGFVFPEISKDGYGPLRPDPISVPEPDPIEWEWTLLDEARLRGRVVLDGQPASDFSVHYWRDGADESVHTESFQKRDGTFNLLVSAGRLSVTASSPAVVCGPVVSVTVTKGETTDVTIELPAPRTASGRVVERSSGQPIAGAEIQPWTLAGAKYVAPWGSPIRSASDGRFEVTGFTDGMLHLVVSAPGYSANALSHRPIAGGPIQLGSVELGEEQPLVIRLLGCEPVDVDRYTFQVEGETYLPERAFDPDGSATVPGLGAGSYLITLYRDNGLGQRLLTDLRLGEEWLVEFPTPSGNAGASLRATIRSLAYDESQFLWGNLITQLPGEASALEQFCGIGKDHVARFEAARPGPFRLDIGAGNTVLGHYSGTLDSGLNELSVELNTERSDFSVVTGDGASVPGATLLVAKPGSFTISWSAATDSLGRATLTGLAEGEYDARVSHPELGQSTTLPVLIRSGAKDPYELVLDANSTLAVQLHDGDLAAANVAAELRSPGDRFPLLSGSSSLDGRLRWDKLQGADYVLSIVDSRYWRQDHSVRSGTPEASLQVRRLGSVHVRPVTPEGLPITGLSLEIRSEEYQVSVAGWIQDGRLLQGSSLTADADGLVRLLELPHGRYTWTAVGHPAGGGLVVRPGQLTEERVVVTPR